MGRGCRLPQLCLSRELACSLCSFDVVCVCVCICVCVCVHASILFVYLSQINKLLIATGCCRIELNVTSRQLCKSSSSSPHCIIPLSAILNLTIQQHIIITKYYHYHHRIALTFLNSASTSSASFSLKCLLRNICSFSHTGGSGAGTG